MIEKLGPYRIDKLLGRGGMGTVYAGTHEETGERAAIKALSVMLADDGNFRERFVAEIETLKHLRHPNIVQLYGDGEQDGHLFYVMELVDGKTLQEELQQGHNFTWQEVTKIGIEVCEALKHAHAHGIIHRDLKPANLLRDQDGHIKLADFGIAKLFGATHLTADGSVVGTADYMAPEQSDDQPISYRTDLYSLGNVLFTLLAKRPPFTGKSIPEVLHKLRYEDPPPVRRFSPRTPFELEQIIEQLLQKDPQNRIPTAMVLANRLRAMEHALSSETVAEQPTGQHAVADVSPNDQATRVSGVEQGPVTEVGPTAVDAGPQSGSQGYSWNDATVVTSESNSPNSAVSPQSRDTVIDEPASRNRFTTVEEGRQASEAAPESKLGSYLTTAAIVFAMLAMGGLIFLAMREPSPEKKYARILAAVDRDDSRNVKRYSEEFLLTHGRHPRAKEVRGMLLDVRCKYLFSRLRNDAKRRELTPVQQAYVEAMKLKEEQPQSAVDKFSELIDDFDGIEEEPDPITCVEAAHHQRARLLFLLAQPAPDDEADESPAAKSPTDESPADET